MYNKKLLIFDYDGVLFDTIPKHIEYLNNRFSIESVPEDYGDGPWHLVIEKYTGLTLTREQLHQDILKNFLMSKDWHRDICPMDGMVKTIKSLYKKGFTLMIATRRFKEGRFVIVDSLNRYHIASCFEIIHCTSQDLGHTILQEPKKKFLRAITGEKTGFFDDTLKEIEEAKDILPSYLFDPLGLNKMKDINSIRHFEVIDEMFR